MGEQLPDEFCDYGVEVRQAGAECCSLNVRPMLVDCSAKARQPLRKGSQWNLNSAPVRVTDGTLTEG